MPFDPELFQNLITSPPGFVTAGALVFGLVSKFFEKVESILSTDTKLEIAVGLLDASQKIARWPERFNKLFEAVFGFKYFSSKGLRRCCAVSIIVFFISTSAVYLYACHCVWTQWKVTLGFAVGFMIFDYPALMITRFVLNRMRLTNSVIIWSMLLFADFAATWMLSAVGLTLWGTLFLTMLGLHRDDGLTLSDPLFWSLLPDLYVQHLASATYGLVENLSPHAFVPLPTDSLGEWASGISHPLSNTIPCYLTTFFTSIWLYLYAVSERLLAVGRRFEGAFAWFSAKADIANKPLSAIGLVSGSLCAILFWLLLLARHIVRTTS